MTKKYTEEEMQSNELKRIENEENRIENEENRIENEAERIANEIERVANEKNRIENDAERVANEEIRNEFYEGFNDRLDVVNSQLAHIENLNINILDFEELIKDNDYTEALIKALEVAKHGDTIVFPTTTIIISRKITISKGVTINFNGSEIIANVSDNDVFNLGFTGESKNRIKILNFNFIRNELMPNTIIKIDGSINTKINGNFFGVKANNSIIHNYKGYGTRIKSEFRYCYSPSAIYLSSSSSSIHSFDIKIDCDITGQQGIGIEMEGGTIDIQGVVENCSIGGVYYNGIHNLNSCNLQVHCESNKEYDVKLGRVERNSNGSWGVGEVNIVSSLFGVNSNDENFKAILYGSHINLYIINSTGVKGYMLNSSVVSSYINIIGRGNCEEDISRDVIVNKIYGGTVNLSNINSRSINNVNNITTPTINTKQIVSVNDIVTLYTDDQSIQFGSNGILPATTMKTSIGGKWNMFNNIYSRYVVMMSPNGTRYQLSVDDNGKLKTTTLQ